MQITTALLAFIVSSLAAAVITPLIIAIYRRHKWLDDPSQGLHIKKVHTRSLPRGGGWAIFGAVMLAALIFLPMTRQVMAILSGALVLTVIGFLDDIFDIHPFIRLVAGGVAALLVVSSGIGIAYINNPFGHGLLYLNQPQLSFVLSGVTHSVWILSDLFALFFIVWNMNIVNWSKGVDGQMPGFVAIALIFLGILSTRFINDPSQLTTLTLSFIVAGAFGGFLLWNKYPQKILAGYGAGSLGGYFLGVLAILSGAKVATTLMVLAIPTADAIFTISRRLIAGKSPWWGDRGHLHHKLMDVLGWSKSQVALFYWVTSLIMGLLSLFLPTAGKMGAIAVGVISVFGFLIWAKLHHQPTIL